MPNRPFSAKRGAGALHHRSASDAGHARHAGKEAPGEDLRERRTCSDGVQGKFKNELCGAERGRDVTIRQGVAGCGPLGGRRETRMGERHGMERIG